MMETYSNGDIPTWNVPHFQLRYRSNKFGSRCGRQQWPCVVVESMVASSTIHICIWENPWGGGNLVSSQRDGKSSTLEQEMPPWYQHMLFLMWLGCHGFPNETNPMMPSTWLLIMTLLTMMTTWCMWTCGLNSLLDLFDVKAHDIWEGNMTTRREI